MSMTPMRRGDTPVWEITVTENGAPFDLTGYTIRMTAKRNMNDSDADAVFQLSTDAGTITITNAAGGIAQARPLRSDTSDLTTDVTVFVDVQIAEDGSPDVTYTVFNDTLLVQRDVTRTAP